MCCDFQCSWVVGEEVVAMVHSMGMNVLGDVLQRPFLLILPLREDRSWHAPAPAMVPLF